MPKHWITYKRRIALTGLRNSGKTVFLTSLLDHLHNSNPKFLFEKNKHIDLFKHMPLKTGEFDYLGNRNYIARGHQFPPKTLDGARYSCQLCITGELYNYELEFLDFPGERFTDVLMVDKSFEEWSDSVWKLWDTMPIQEWIDFKRASEGTTEECIAAFRRFLAAKTLAFHPHITPSTFRLGQKGEGLRGNSVDALTACGTWTGCDEHSQFTPLAATVRKSNPDGWNAMVGRYEKYRKEIVEPLFRELKNCDRLIVLLDVPYLLAAGANAQSENHEVLKNILAAASPNMGVWEWFSWLAWSWRRVTRIAFVASKSDLVVARDHDKMLNLVKEYIQPFQTILNGTDHRYFTASPIVSTVSLDETDAAQVGRLVGRPKYETRDGKRVKRSPELPDVEFMVSRLPNSWPIKTNAGQYRFPEVHPAMPTANFVSPPHENLDQVFDYIIH